MGELTDDEMERQYAFWMAGDRIHRTDQYRQEFRDWLARVKAEAAAEAWGAGARWAFEEITGEPENRFGLASGDNPHRVVSDAG